MYKKIGNNYEIGRLIIDKVSFDHIFKRRVMKSGKVGKIYLPKELIGFDVFVVVKYNKPTEVKDES